MPSQGVDIRKRQHGTFNQDMATETPVPLDNLEKQKMDLNHRVQMLEEAKLELIASVEHWMNVATKNSERIHKQQLIIKHLEKKIARVRTADRIREEILTLKKKRLENESVLRERERELHMIEEEAQKNQ
ncbi:hypothetical protein E4T43_06893 [Aureobasidium subglaciale]|nr:hypothetical protein E4T43_06893 [Aureobasidium subglaciale]